MDQSLIKQQVEKKGKIGVNLMMMVKQLQNNNIDPITYIYNLNIFSFEIIG